MTLLNKTLHLIRDTSIPMETIAISTGLTKRWLYEFKAGEYKDPGVTKVEKVFDYLKRRK